MLHQFSVFRRRRLRCVEDDQHQIGVRQCFHGLAYANGFGFVEGLPDSRRVDKLDWDATDGDGFADQVTCGARSRRDDGALAFDQAVEQA